MDQKIIVHSVQIWTKWNGLEGHCRNHHLHPPSPVYKAFRHVEALNQN